MDDVRFDPENALTRGGGSRAEVECPAEPTPNPADEDLAARRRAVLGRLARAHHTSPLTPKEHKP